MKNLFSLFLAALLLAGCSSAPVAQVTDPTITETSSEPLPTVEPIPAPEYSSRFATVTTITLSDDGITSGSDAVYTSSDIIYYENKTEYESGNPYGEGGETDRHTLEEAAAHTVVNITAPGAYRVTGTLSAGQLRIDLGEEAYSDPTAVVELILDNCDITCAVAPAILFLNTYECDGSWSTDTAQPTVDTTAAGANLILEGSNTVSGSHVAKIFKDNEEEKKLWKQDGAIYSYMSLNVFGPGSLDLTADNEGLDTELHLTINGGNIVIRSDNDGINTNEDGVSVTTINGGNIHITAGLGAEGDGIDSNGFLVINGGTVMASANPAADAGMDSDLGSYIHGGTVIALGSTMDWAESDSDQVTMNLQFASQQKAGSRITVTREDGTQIFSFEDDRDTSRSFSGLILSHPYFNQGETYHIFIDDIQMAYTGTDVGRGPGGMGGFGGGQRPEMPEGFDPKNIPEGGFDGQHPNRDFDPQNLPEDFTMPEGMTPGEPPEGFDSENLPQDFTRPEGETPEMPPNSFGHGQGGKTPNTTSGETSTAFFMTDKVNAFSGLTPVQ